MPLLLFYMWIVPCQLERSPEVCE